MFEPMKRLLLVTFMVVACSRKQEAMAPTAAAPAKPVTSTAASAPATTPSVPLPAVPRSSTGALDACSLISPEELKRITGSSFSAGVNSTSQADVMRCTFPRLGGGGISIFLHLKDVSGEYSSMPGTTAVPGVPDQAFWNPRITTFVDRKGSHVLLIGFNFAGGDQKKWGEEIAREIVPRL